MTTILLTGDVMIGRGIDQVLPNPLDPILYESFMTSARGYVRLAEERNGLIPRNASFDYIWGTRWNPCAGPISPSSTSRRP
jgi:poly-gamma-glutamate synthesis protein (capsule biosynthesis protein)